MDSGCHQGPGEVLGRLLPCLFWFLGVLAILGLQTPLQSSPDCCASSGPLPSLCLCVQTSLWGPALWERATLMTTSEKTRFPHKVAFWGPGGSGSNTSSGERDTFRPVTCSEQVTFEPRHTPQDRARSSALKTDFKTAQLTEDL